MSPRLAIAPLVGALILTVVACRSSGRYGTPTNAAIGTGFAVAGAAAVRAAGGCWAQCLPGTVCNPKNGLCERIEPEKRAKPAIAGHPPRTAGASYPAGHEYDVPPADAGCDPPPITDAGALTCEMDAAAASR